MMRLLLYLLLFGIVLYFLSIWGKKQHDGGGAFASTPKTKGLFKAKPNPLEIWTQVYETDALEEARRLQARIQEEEVSCIVYEQGKKDIHGNQLRGIGIAVPKTAMRLAQSIINRLLP